MLGRVRSSRSDVPIVGACVRGSGRRKSRAMDFFTKLLHMKTAKVGRVLSSGALGSNPVRTGDSGEGSSSTATTPTVTTVPSVPPSTVYKQEEHETNVQFAREFVVQLVETVPRKSEKVTSPSPKEIDKQERVSLTSVAVSEISFQSADTSFLPDLLQPEAVYKKQTDTDTDTTEYESAAETDPLSSSITEDLLVSFQEGNIGASPAGHIVGVHKTDSSTSLSFDDPDVPHDSSSPLDVSGLCVGLGQLCLDTSSKGSASCADETLIDVTLDSVVDVSCKSVDLLSAEKKPVKASAQDPLLDLAERSIFSKVTTAESPIGQTDLPSLPLITVISASPATQNELTSNKEGAGYVNTEHVSIIDGILPHDEKLESLLCHSLISEETIPPVSDALSLTSEQSKTCVHASRPDSTETKVVKSPLWEYEVVESLPIKELETPGTLKSAEITVESIPISSKNKPLLESSVNENKPLVESPVNENKPLVESPVNEKDPLLESPVNEKEPLLESPVNEKEPLLESPVNEKEPLVESPVNENELLVESPLNKAPEELPVNVVFEELPVNEVALESPVKEVLVKTPIKKNPTSLIVQSLQTATSDSFCDSTPLEGYLPTKDKTDLFDIPTAAHKSDLDIQPNHLNESLELVKETRSISSETFNIVQESPIKSLECDFSSNQTFVSNINTESLNTTHSSNSSIHDAVTKNPKQLTNSGVSDLSRFKGGDIKDDTIAPAAEKSPIRDIFSLKKEQSESGLRELYEVCDLQQKSLELGDDDNFVNAPDFFSNENADIHHEPASRDVNKVFTSSEYQWQETVAEEAKRVSLDFLTASRKADLSNLSESDNSSSFNTTAGVMENTQVSNSVEKVNPFVGQSSLRRSPPSAARTASPLRGSRGLSPAKKTSGSNSSADLVGAESPRARAKVSGSSSAKELGHADAVDPFKPRSRLTNTPPKDHILSSGDSPIISQAIQAVKVESGSDSPKSTINSEINLSEAGPEIAEDANLKENNVFKDPSEFDFLSSLGSTQPSNRSARLDSLYVKFDPLVGSATTTDENIVLPPVIAANNRVVSNGNSYPDSRVKTEPVQAQNFPQGPNPALSYVEKLISLSPSPKNKAAAQLSPVVTPEPRLEVKIERPSPALRQILQTSKEELVELTQTDTMTEELYILRELLNKQDQAYEAKMSEKEAELALMQDKLKEADERIIRMSKKMSERTQGQQQMSMILDEYEKTISRMVADKEQEQRTHDAKMAALLQEKTEAKEHLDNLEIAFSDIHKKYEKCKDMLEGLRKNEEILRSSLAEHQATLHAQEQKYDALKNHAMMQLERANTELDAIKRSHAAEVSKFNAMLKKAEVKTSSLEESLEQKIKENQELASICDELISKVGSSGD
uniref:Transforming acidic coiled-coil-containing protein C-terminal domain-containing protein n=1 Tax=Timema genevievae TaxID=629358 RepID=A0A7R9PHA3_TIMGE|nr:unnamed protein product [Timema genevievae]